MSKTRVNYDAVAPSYDQRTEKGFLQGIAAALQNLARQVQAQRVLDLGCGTGRSLYGLAGMSPGPVCYGLDFSAGMLAQAQQFNTAYRLTQATAPYPPFAPASFDLVFCLHAFHHFPNKPRVVQAAYTLLRPGGALAIINIDPYQGRQSWYIYNFFEGVYETDLARFPSLAEQEAMLNQAGFQHINQQVVEQFDDKIVGEAIFDFYFLSKNSTSQLILLSDEAYQAGLARMRAAIAEAKTRGEEVIFENTQKNWMSWGIKPI